MSFQGLEIPLPLAEFGLVGSKNLARVPPTALLRALNIAFDQGPVTRAGGSAKYNATPFTGAPSVRGLFDFWPTPTTQRLVAWSTDGKVRQDDGTSTFPTTMKTGLDATGLPVWAEGGAEVLANNKKAFLATGKDIVQVIDGTAVVTRDINGTKPADWAGANQPRAILQHRNRMFGLMQHRVYWSTLGDHEDYGGAGSGSVPIFPGISSYLQGGISFKEHLYLWKFPLGIFIFDDSDVTVSNWTVRDITRGIGLAGPRALCVIDDDVLFLSEVGHLHLLSNVRNVDITVSDLTAANDLVVWTRENVELDATILERAQAVYYQERKEAHISVAGGGSATLNLRLVVDLNRAGTPRIRVEDKDVCESVAMWRDSKKILRPISGDNAGTVWKLDQASKNKAGAGYSSEFQTPHTDFAWFAAQLAARQKNYAWLELVTQPLGNFDLSVDTILDGAYKETITFNLGSTAPVLGSFTLDTDKLAGDLVLNKRKRMHGSSRRLSLLARMSGADQDFSVSQFIVGCMPGGEKL